MVADIPPYWLQNRRERAAPRKRRRGKSKRYRAPRGFTLPEARKQTKFTKPVKRVVRDTRFLREGAGKGFERGKEAARSGFTWLRDAVRSVREDAKSDEVEE